MEFQQKLKDHQPPLFQTMREPRKLSQTATERLLQLTKSPMAMYRLLNIVGPIFSFLDQIQDLLKWTDPSRTFSYYLAFLMACYHSEVFLSVFVPVGIVALIIEGIRNNNNSSSINNQQKQTIDYLAMGFNGLTAAAMVDPMVNYEKYKDLADRVLRLSEYVDEFCDMYEAVFEYLNRLHQSIFLPINNGEGQDYKLNFQLLGGIAALWSAWTVFIVFVSFNYQIMFIGSAVFLYNTPVSELIRDLSTYSRKSILPKIPSAPTITASQLLEKRNRLIQLTKSLSEPILGINNVTGKLTVDGLRVSTSPTLSPIGGSPAQSTQNSNTSLPSSTINNGMMPSLINSAAASPRSPQSTSKSNFSISDSEVEVVEYQRYWLGLGWIHHPLPNESGPYQDAKRQQSYKSFQECAHSLSVPAEELKIRVAHGETDWEGWQYMTSLNSNSNNGVQTIPYCSFGTFIRRRVFVKESNSN